MSRFKGGACAIIMGLLVTFGPIPALLTHGPYFKINATYVSQRITDRFLDPQLQVKVRFKVGSNPPVTTYVYPVDKSLPSAHRSIPIIFFGPKPSEAYYAGPGGDAKLLPGIFSWTNLGAGLIAVGVYFLLSAIIWRRQMLVLVRNPGERRTVRLSWRQLGSKGSPTVLITIPESGLEYSWQVLPPETAPASMLVAFLRLFRRSERPVDGDSSDVPRSDVAEITVEPGPHKWIIVYDDGQLTLPISRAEPVIGTGRSIRPPADISSIATAHRRLLASYSTVLEEARRLPVFIRPPAKSDAMPLLRVLRTLLCWRWLVRLHVESHVRRQLRHLDGAYIRSQMVTPKGGYRAEKKRRNFGCLRDESQLLANSLTDIRRRVTSFIIGLATILPVILVTIKIHQLQLDRLVEKALILILFSLVVMPGVFALMAYTDAFRCKRRLFASCLAPGISVQSTHGSIYRLEDELFCLLGQEKRLESMQDFIAYFLVLAGGTTIWIWAFLTPGPTFIGASQWIVLTLVTMFFVWRFVANLKRRLHEER
jgi:hypothetical protein